MAGEITDSDVIMVDQPASDITALLTLRPDKTYKFNIDPQSWRGVTEEDGALSIIFDNNSTLVLENFAEAMEAEMPAEITFDDGQFLSLEEFSYVLRLAEAMGTGMKEDIIREEEPSQSAILGVTAAEELSGIEPAVGETSTPLMSGLLFLAGMILASMWLLHFFKDKGRTH